MSDAEIKKEYERVGAWGLLASIDLHGCDREKVRSERALRSFIKELLEVIDMKGFGEPLVMRFGEGELEGWSGLQMIETSNLAVHLEEIKNRVFLDIFSCKYFEILPAAEFAKKFWSARDYDYTYKLRY